MSTDMVVSPVWWSPLDPLSTDRPMVARGDVGADSVAVSAASAGHHPPENVTMKKLLLLASTLFAVLGTTSIATAADSWTCGYQGSWTTTSTGNVGSFEWTVQWADNGAGWAMIGEYDDKYGHAMLDGSCANKACAFTQTYTTGELKGKVYHWKGTYVDEKVRDGETVNRFKGTWGYSAAAKDGGPWDAVAMCRKN